MISKEKAFKLVSIYCYISEMYDKSLKYTCQRQSNNSDPIFTDAEVMTVFLYAASEEHLHKIKHIHCFAKNRLLSWFFPPAFSINNLSIGFLSMYIERPFIR